jgi:two-component system, chemotaxis family, sensor kinase CheA
LTLKLPLTLAIIDGFLVKIGDTSYVLPLSSVEECLELPRAEADKAQERSMINLRGQVVAYMSLRRYFAIDQQAPSFEQVVVSEANGVRVGFGVDRFIGQHQTVIKSLGKAYRGIREVSGATILGDGSVALILDINQLVEGLQQHLDQAA